MRPFNNIIVPADTDGCGFWRFNQANFLVYQNARNLRISNSILQKPVSDPNYYLDVDSIMLQRCIDPGALDYFKFLRQIAD